LTPLSTSGVSIVVIGLVSFASSSPSHQVAGTMWTTIEHGDAEDLETG
jgi:hypothetical protein